MSIAHKAWGTNEVLHSTPAVKVCRLFIMPGGFCSMHHHDAKDNTFIVEHGSLTVEEWEPDGSPSGVHVLQVRQHHTVRPGVVHRFVNYSRAPAQVLEVESPSLLSDGDIKRRDEGGILGTTR